MVWCAKTLPTDNVILSNKPSPKLVNQTLSPMTNTKETITSSPMTTRNRPTITSMTRMTQSTSTSKNDTPGVISRSDQINLGVGISFGVLGAVAAVATVCTCLQTYKKKGRVSEAKAVYE